MKLLFLVSLCFTCFFHTLFAQEQIQLSKEDSLVIRQNKAVLVYGNETFSVDAFHIYKDVFFVFSKKKERVYLLNEEGLVKKEWKLKTWSLSTPHFYQVGDTIKLGIAQRKTVSFYLQNKKWKSYAKSVEVPLKKRKLNTEEYTAIADGNNELLAISYATSPSEKEPVLAILAYQEGNGKYNIIHQVNGKHGKYHISTRGYKNMDILRWKNHWLVLDTYASQILVFNQAFEKVSQITLEIEDKHKKAIKLLHDKVTNSLYLSFWKEKQTFLDKLIFTPDFEQLERIPIRFFPKYLNIQQVYGAKVYYLLIGKKAAPNTSEQPTNLFVPQLVNRSYYIFKTEL